MLIVGNHYLFAYAEVAENVGEDLVGGYLAGYLAEIGIAFANVLGEKFAAYTGFHG